MGVGLCAIAAGWTFVSAAVAGGDPLPEAALLLAVGVVYAASRAVAEPNRAIVALVGAVAALALAWLHRGDLLAPRALGGPLGYSNASAELYLQGATAGLMLAAVVSGRIVKVGGWALALLLAVATVLSRSQAGDVLLVLPAAALAFRTPARARALIAASAGALIVVLLVTSALGLGYRPGRGDSNDVAERLLSERRLALWHDALVLIERHPWTGVGPGRFQDESPVARSDPDARWAHHGFLQAGAETGVPGLAIVVAIFAWAFVRLWRVPDPGVATALGAASLSALGIHACIDYVFHFPALPLIVAALVGAAATAGRLSRDEEGRC